MWLYVLVFGAGFMLRHVMDAPNYTEDAVVQAEAIVEKNTYLLSWIEEQKRLKKERTIDHL